MAKKPYVLIIRDGWGFNPDRRMNAIAHAETPNHDKYIKEYPTALLTASGERVGLPAGNQGSSEVGHLNMGAGRIVYQSLVRISNTVENGDFFKNDALLGVVRKVKENRSTLHLWGLVQDQGVHSHNDHLIALLKLAAEQGLQREQVQVHVFSDGRDTPPRSVENYLIPLKQAMEQHGVGFFGSIVGRYFAMDRDTRWDRVQAAYDLLTDGKAEGEFSDIDAAVQDAYSADENDEFIKPRRISGFKPVADKDGVIFFNYRLDRTRELTKAFVEDGFGEFPVKEYSELNFVCFTEYYEGVAKSGRAAVSVAFPPRSLANLFGEFVAQQGMRQLRIAETEKFAHVTFFFNGQSDVVFENEDRELIPSPSVATYDLQPEMSAYQVKDRALEMIAADKYDVIILNYANPDMVGHTGVFDAAVKACTVVDQCVGAVVDAVLAKDGVVFLTSDHGNAEQMEDYVTGKPMTAHTVNPVWFSLISNRPELQNGKVRVVASGGKLADLIPTMLDVMQFDLPADMEGTTLLQRNS